MNIVALGATSKISETFLRKYAQSENRFHIFGRSSDKLQVLAKDLMARGAPHVEVTVIGEKDSYSRIAQLAVQGSKNVGLLLVAQGYLGDQKRAEREGGELQTILDVNFNDVVQFIMPIANQMIAAKHGQIVIISSVAGDRGRQSNYLYGCAKAGLTTFAQGLRNRLFPYGVRVLTVKPGFVDTPMTADTPKNFLFAKPEDIALGMQRAIAQYD